MLYPVLSGKLRKRFKEACIRSMIVVKIEKRLQICQWKFEKKK